MVNSRGTHHVPLSSLQFAQRTALKCINKDMAYLIFSIIYAFFILHEDFRIQIEAGRVHEMNLRFMRSQVPIRKMLSPKNDAEVPCGENLEFPVERKLHFPCRHVIVLVGPFGPRLRMARTWGNSDDGEGGAGVYFRCVIQNA